MEQTPIKLLPGQIREKSLVLLATKVIDLRHVLHVILLLNCGEYGGKWAYECNSPPIRNDHKVIARCS